MTLRRSLATRLTVALVAAYVLVLQGLLGGVLAGQHAGLLALDTAIHLTSCDPGGTSVPQSPADKAPAHLPDCCAQGCQLAAGGLPPAATDATEFAYPPPSPVRRMVAAGDPAAHARPDRSAGKPRAPPASA